MMAGLSQFASALPVSVGAAQSATPVANEVAGITKAYYYKRRYRGYRYYRPYRRRYYYGPRVYYRRHYYRRPYYRRHYRRPYYGGYRYRYRRW